MNKVSTFHTIAPGQIMGWSQSKLSQHFIVNIPGSTLQSFINILHPFNQEKNIMEYKIPPKYRFAHKGAHSNMKFQILQVCLLPTVNQKKNKKENATQFSYIQTVEYTKGKN